MKSFLGSQLWQLFKYAELTEVVRQNDVCLFDCLSTYLIKFELVGLMMM